MSFDEMTKAELLAELGRRSIDAPAKATKAALLALVVKNDPVPNDSSIHPTPHMLPETEFGGLQHVLEVSCWCNPVVTEVNGEPMLTHFPEATYATSAAESSEGASVEEGPPVVVDDEPDQDEPVQGSEEALELAHMMGVDVGDLTDPESIYRLLDHNQANRNRRRYDPYAPHG